jgi:hypothetical protein
MQENTKRNWLYIFSPCVVAMLFAVFAIIYFSGVLKNSGGRSGVGVSIFSMFLLIVFLIDMSARLIIGKRAGILWLVETILIVATILIFNNKFL